MKSYQCYKTPRVLQLIFFTLKEHFSKNENHFSKKVPLTHAMHRTKCLPLSY